MKRVLGCLIVAGAVLLLTFTAGADCGRFQRARVVQHAAYVAPYVAPAAVAVYVPLYQPSYSVSYDPTGGAAGLAILEELRAAREETRALRAEMLKMAARGAEGPGPMAPVPAYIPPSGKGPSHGGSLFFAKCASCHTAGSERMGAPGLFNAGEVINGLGIPEKILNVLRTGKMGKMKAPPLNADERLEMTFHLFDLPAPEAVMPPAAKLKE